MIQRRSRYIITEMYIIQMIGLAQQLTKGDTELDDRTRNYPIRTTEKIN